MKAESFTNWFREACKTAGVKGSAHGIRKLESKLTAESSASQQELKARFGWTSDATARVYIETADKAKLARVANSKRFDKAPHLTAGAVQPDAKELKNKDFSERLVGDERLELPTTSV